MGRLESSDNSALAPSSRASSTLECADKSKDNRVSQIRPGFKQGLDSNNRWSVSTSRVLKETKTKSVAAKTTSLGLHHSYDEQKHVNMDSCDIEIDTALGHLYNEKFQSGSMAAVRTVVWQARSRSNLFEVEKSAIKACAERIQHLHRKIGSRNASGLKQIQEPRDKCERYRIFTEVQEIADEDDSPHASSSTDSLLMEWALSHTSVTSSSEPCASDTPGDDEDSSSEPCASDTPGEDEELAAPSATCEIEMPSKDEELLSLRMLRDRILARIHEELWASSAPSEDDDLVVISDQLLAPSKVGKDRKDEPLLPTLLHDLASRKSSTGRKKIFTTM